MIINSLIFIIAIQHLFFLVLEMFLWEKKLGLKIFRQTSEQAKASATLAANQGLYNGFLSAGLIWSLLHSDMVLAFQLKVFFASCVMIAGVFGAFTVSSRILFIQALPAFITLILLFISL